MVLLSSTTLPQIRVFSVYIHGALFRIGPQKNMTNLTILNSWVFLAAFTLEVTPRGTSLWLALLMREEGAV